MVSFPHQSIDEEQRETCDSHDREDRRGDEGKDTRDLQEDLDQQQNLQDIGKERHDTFISGQDDISEEQHQDQRHDQVQDVAGTGDDCPVRNEELKQRRLGQDPHTGSQCEGCQIETVPADYSVPYPRNDSEGCDTQDRKQGKYDEVDHSRIEHIKNQSLTSSYQDGIDIPGELCCRTAEGYFQDLSEIFGHRDVNKMPG